MQNHLVTMTLAVLALGGAAQAASAASLSVDRACYADPSQRVDTVSFAGGGFAPGGAYTVTLDGTPVAGAAGKADAAGNVQGSFIAPALGSRSNEHVYTLAVSDTHTTQQTKFTVARLFADFRPSQGNPVTLKISFALFGFGLTGTPSPQIYVHYVRPNGKLKATYALGHGRGDCGSRRATAQRRLFSFKPEHGAWHLQFDTSKRYVKGTRRSTFLFYTVPVSVKPGK